MTSYAREILKYSDSAQFTNDETKLLKQMISDYKMNVIVNEKMGVFRDLRAASLNMLNRADDLIETIPLLPTINFEGIEKITDFNLQSGVEVENFIFKFNFFPYLEFGTVSDVQNYDKSIKLLIYNPQGFWSRNNTFTLRVYNVFEINDGYGWSFSLEIFNFDEETGIKNLYYSNKLIISDYDYVVLYCASIISMDTELDDGTPIEGNNYFDILEYQREMQGIENVVAKLYYGNVGVGRHREEIMNVNQDELNPSLMNLWEMRVSGTVSTYYQYKGNSVITNQFKSNVELSLTYLEEISVHMSSFTVPDIDKDYEEKLSYMLNYELLSYASRMYTAISSAVYDRQIQTLFDNDNDLSAVLLTNDEIIFKKLAHLPDAKELSITAPNLNFTGFKHKIKYLRKLSFRQAYDSTHETPPPHYLLGKVNLVPGWGVAEHIHQEFDSGPINISTTVFHRVYENNDVIVLAEVTLTPIDVISCGGASTALGVIDVTNLNGERKVCQFKTVSIPTVGASSLEIAEIQVSILSIRILMKGAIGFGTQPEANFSVMFGFGDVYDKIVLSESGYSTYSNMIMEYQGSLYYGYSCLIPDKVITGIVPENTARWKPPYPVPSETVEISTKDNTQIEYKQIRALESNGFNITVGYRSASGGFLSAARLEVVPTGNSMKYFCLSEIEYVRNMEGVLLYNRTIQEVIGADVTQCGYQGVWFSCTGDLVCVGQYPSDGTSSQTIITSDYATANTAIIQQLIIDIDNLQDEFEQLSSRVQYLEEAFDEMNKKGPFFLQMLEIVAMVSGPLSMAFDMVQSSSHFIKDITYQNKLNRLTVGQMKTSATLKDKNFNISHHQSKNMYVDGYLHSINKSRSDIYKDENLRPYFLNGNENVSKIDLAEKLDLMATIRTGGLVDLSQMDDTTVGLVKGNLGDFKGLHPTFNVWARPLETLPKPIGDGAFKIGTKFSKLRRGNVDKAFKTNTRLPFHTAGSFDDYRVENGVPVRTRRWIGIGEPNTRNQTVSDKGAGIGGFRYESKLVGKEGDTLVWRHEPFENSGLSNDELESLYYTSFKKSDVHLTVEQKYDKLIRHTENRIGTSHLLYSYVPDSSFSEALDIFINKVDLKYDLLTQNCQTLMLNLLNYSQSGYALTSLTRETQASLIRARLEAIDRAAKLFFS